MYGTLDLISDSYTDYSSYNTGRKKKPINKFPQQNALQCTPLQIKFNVVESLLTASTPKNIFTNCRAVYFLLPGV